MKKILYIMNVDWNWIKQRPHFVAEILAKEYERDYQVEIVYRYRYNRKKLQRRDNEGLNLLPIYVIPKLSAIPKLKWINDKIFNIKLKKIIRRQEPDILYLTYPLQIQAVPDSFAGRILYDCMDNHSAFLNQKFDRERLESKERELILKSSRTLVSSMYLLELMSKRYKIETDKFVLVRNAYDGKVLDNVEEKNAGINFKMAYIGTISSWFDWKTIIDVLSNNELLQLHLYGPLDKTCIPENSRIFYHGTIEHDKLYESIRDIDCLIMPFIVNEIIKAVDPVKVYEYINFKKDIIMCYYDEVSRWEDFVYFYRTPEEFSSAIRNIIKTKKVKYSDEKRIDFLKANNWKNRVNQITNIIEHETRN